MPVASNIADFVQRAARQCGFDLAGVAPASPFAELDAFPAWLAAGHAGEMSYLAARNDRGELKRSSLAHVAPWARSVVVCAMNYDTAQPRSTDEHAPDAGWISRYAWSEVDYHDHLLPRLRLLEAELKQFAGQEPHSEDPHSKDIRTWCYVDTGPVIERVFARYAGIGWVGKNTCIINQQLGSYIFLGVILTSLEVSPSLPPPDRCGTCTRCLDVCPTNAFTAPHHMDASRCISYLTIEKRGDIPEPLREAIGRHVYGCDLCQDVCPWNGRNRRAPATSQPEFQPRPGLVNPSLEWLATMTPDDFRRVFKGSAIKRTKLTGMRRNAVVAMGNSGQQRFLPLLERLAHDEDPVVAEHARWAADKLATQ